MKLKCKEIRVDGGTQPREKIDFDLVREYAEARAAGDEFPPADVFFDGESYWLADGFHRYHAAYIQPEGDLECTVHQGSRRDAVLFSTGANGAHGLRRTNADKRRAVTALLSDVEWAKWSDREIGRQCRVSDHLVAQIREELSANSRGYGERTVTRNGKTYTMKLPEKAVEEAQARAAAGEEIGVEEAKEILERHVDDGLPEELFRADGETGKAVVYSPPVVEPEQEAAMAAILGEDEPEEKESIFKPDSWYIVDTQQKLLYSNEFDGYHTALSALPRQSCLIRAGNMINSMEATYANYQILELPEQVEPDGESEPEEEEQAVKPERAQFVLDTWYILDNKQGIIYSTPFDQYKAAIKAAPPGCAPTQGRGLRNPRNYEGYLVSMDQPWADESEPEDEYEVKPEQVDKYFDEGAEENDTKIDDLIVTYLERFDELISMIADQPGKVQEIEKTLDLSYEATQALHQLYELLDTGA